MSMDNGELMKERTLTVISHGEERGKSTKNRVTIPQGMIVSVIASENPVQKSGGGQQHKVHVLLMDGNQLELYISGADLAILERAAGLYFTPA
jgi:hypothetical protein